MIGVAYAGEAILAPAPLAYSSLIVDEPKPGYEYSTSVNTPTYNNYAHVRSGGELERKIYNFAAPLATPVIAAQPLIAEAKFVQPVSKDSNKFLNHETGRKVETNESPINVKLFDTQAIAQPILKAQSFEYRTAIPIASPTFIRSTKLLPIAYEAKPFYRFAAASPALVAGNSFAFEFCINLRLMLFS